ncbi:MAG: DUF1080 domain-containing protein [Planctomycetes bacterium]|nr:DUF1080 domain-containing protein [Planctomycetota bacterium]
MLLTAFAVLLQQGLQAGPAPAPPSPPRPTLPAVVLTGANNHEWQWTSNEIASALVETGAFSASVEKDPAAFFVRQAAAGAERPCVLVLDYNGPRWGAEAEATFVRMVKDEGVGVVVVHAANNAFAGWTEYEQMVGLLWRDGSGHGTYHPFDVVVVDHAHPITASMADLRLHPDEIYHHLRSAQGSDHRVLLSAFSDPKQGGTGRHEPMATAGTFGKGRVFHTTLGHVWTGVPATRATWADPQLRLLVARGAQWASGWAVTLPPVPLNRLSADEEKDGFVSLFDGLRIERWRGFRSEAPRSGWTVRDAAIVCSPGSGAGDLVTVDEYGDFDFRFSFRIAPKGNSGVMWHVTETNDHTFMSGPEYQVLDDRGHADGVDAKHRQGALYDLVAPAADVARTPGEWNEGRILVQDGRVKHWLNGALVVDAPCAGPEWDAMVKASKFRDWPFNQVPRGRIALQDHGDEVAYRNLRVKAR